MSEGSAKLPVAGEVLAGKYSIVRVIGEGGMGVVFEGRHDRLGQRVAIKVLREEERKNREVVARFEREARLAAKLRSANVARVTDVDVLADGTPFMVMEYLEGVDLDFELTQRGRLPVPEAVSYVLQACSAVAEAHALGIVHRDLKPHNLFLTDDGERRLVKLLDFGISKTTTDEPDSVTLTRSSLGTPLYMSPEQIRSARNADQRSDLWSLGVILYELITGSPPFDGDGPAAVIASITADTPPPPHELRPEMSRALSDAILRALAKDPAQRYSSVTEFAEAIQPFGVAGSWAPPALTASQPRISFPELPRISADAITLLDSTPGRDSLPDLGESQAPVAASSRPALEPAGAKRVAPLLLAAAAVALVGVGVALGWSSRKPSEASAPAAAPPAPSAPAALHAPTTEPARPTVEPAAPPSPALSSSARASKPRVAGAGPVPSAAPSAPSAKPSAAPASPKSTENPLHL
ncbi:MAG: serine/threonine protein kinase [Myxococcales bacterium]|nr:serine/threonine protein kinase [Myxococcales bacterium]